MEQLQHAVQVMIWVNLAVLSVFGFLVFCWFCETVNKWIGDDGSARRSQRRAQRPVIDRKAAKEAAMQQALREAVAAEVAKLTGGGSP